jgi:hypothetical protein
MQLQKQVMQLNQARGHLQKYSKSKDSRYITSKSSRWCAHKVFLSHTTIPAQEHLTAGCNFRHNDKHYTDLQQKNLKLLFVVLAQVDNINTKVSSTQNQAN